MGEKKLFDFFTIHSSFCQSSCQNGISFGYYFFFVWLWKCCNFFVFLFISKTPNLKWVSFLFFLFTIFEIFGNKYLKLKFVLFLRLYRSSLFFPFKTKEKCKIKYFDFSKNGLKLEMEVKKPFFLKFLL